MRAKKKKKKLEEKRAIRYIPLDDIKTINTEFLTEMERVKQRLMTIKDPAIITAFHEVLLSAYNAAIAIKTYEREVDYDIELAEIEARRDEIKPIRHSWGWRLLFRPLTNRAQDIIEERAELDAERVHGELEKQLDDDWEQLFQKKELSKRELRRQVKKQLKAAIKAADNTETNEGFDEPATPDYVMLTDKAAKSLLKKVQNETVLAQANAGKPTQAQPQIVSTRRPRPPRSCRKQ